MLKVDGSSPSNVNSILSLFETFGTNAEYDYIQLLIEQNVIFDFCRPFFFNYEFQITNYEL